MTARSASFSLRASDSDAARDEALRQGRKENIDYLNEAGETVTWTCVDVLLVHDLLDTEPAEGAEVYSCFVSAELLEEIRAQSVPTRVQREVQRSVDKHPTTDL